MRLRLAIALLAVLALAACARTIDRAAWTKMQPSEKTLYVETLIGAEKAKASKGGNPYTWSKPAAAYVRQIDEAYARVEQRSPEVVFGELHDPS